jgi:hypothetical protein
LLGLVAAGAVAIPVIAVVGPQLSGNDRVAAGSPSSTAGAIASTTGEPSRAVTQSPSLTPTASATPSPTPVPPPKRSLQPGPAGTIALPNMAGYPWVEGPDDLLWGTASDWTDPTSSEAVRDWAVAIDPETNEIVRQIELPMGLESTVFAGSIWVQLASSSMDDPAGMGREWVERLDVTDGRVLQTFDNSYVDGNIGDLVFISRDVTAMSLLPSKIDRIDGSSGTTVGTIPWPGDLGNPEVACGALWAMTVASPDDILLSGPFNRLDPTTGQVTATVEGSHLTSPIEAGGKCYVEDLADVGRSGKPSWLEVGPSGIVARYSVGGSGYYDFPMGTGWWRETVKDTTRTLFGYNPATGKVLTAGVKLPTWTLPTTERTFDGHPESTLISIAYGSMWIVPWVSTPDLGDGVPDYAKQLVRLALPK